MKETVKHKLLDSIRITEKNGMYPKADLSLFLYAKERAATDGTGSATEVPACF